MDQSGGDAFHVVEGVDNELSRSSAALDAVLQSGVVSDASGGR